MTDLADLPSTAGTAPDLATVARLSDSFVDLMRTFLRMRQALMAQAEHDVEWTSHIILRCLRTHGPMRAGAIAEYVHADPSTVSRQVAAVVKEGLVERQADPDDGRASLLVLTVKADAVLADYDRWRADYFADLLEDWTAEEMDQFAAQLERFTESYRTRGEEWMTHKAVHPLRRQRSTD